MDITYISPYFYPVWGGTENYCLNIARQSKALGHTVRVITSDRKGDQVFQRKVDEHDGVKVIRLRRWLFGQYYLTFWPSLPWKILRLKTDVIHSNIPGVMWVDLSLIIKKLFSPNTVFINSPHDPFMSRSAYSRPERVLRRIYLPFLKLYYNWLYDYVITVTKPQKEWLINDYKVSPEKIIYVPCGINDAQFDQLETDPQLVKKYDLSGKLLLSMVARYHEYKGYQQVLEALTKLPASRREQIKFIGMGQDSGWLKRLRQFAEENDLQNCVTLLENPNDMVKNQLLQLSEIFILASRAEAFGIVIIEAMAKGNAIITTKTEGGLFLINPDNGILYDFEDVDALAKAIDELTEDDGRRQAMREHNQKYARQFLWSNTFTGYAKLLKKIATVVNHE